MNQIESSITQTQSNPMCGSRKYPYPPQGRSLAIPRGRGVSNTKIFKVKYEAKLEIPGGRGGSNQKTFCGGGMDIFWNHTMGVNWVQSLNQSPSQSARYPYPAEGNEILWDKVFHHDMRSRTGSQRILSWQDASTQSTLLPIPLLNKGNDGSGNQIEHNEH